MFKAAYTKDTEWNDTAWRGTKASKRFNELVVAAASKPPGCPKNKVF